MKKISLLSVLLSMVFMLFAAGNLFALSGPCVDCHTMHNSQDGAVMGEATPSDALLLASSCSGCHARAGVVNDGTNSIPQIDGSTYGTNTLAGGSFYWVSFSGDAYGHNVEDFGDAVDATLGEDPPGWDPAYGVALSAPNWGTNQLTCAGVYGCHGDHTVTDKFGAVQGAHHYSGATNLAVTGGSYRFLLGIAGIEDADWEYTTSVTDHNVYQGTDRTGGSADDTSSISYFCAKCHGDFHASADVNADTSTMSNPWLRHPTDIDMVALGGEYAGYGGLDGYVVEAPVALSTLAAPTATSYDAEAVVTCLSCHRPHGSDQLDLLRWDYTTMTVGALGGAGGGEGCFHCHTSKDGV